MDVTRLTCMVFNGNLPPQATLLALLVRHFPHPLKGTHPKGPRELTLCTPAPNSTPFEHYGTDGQARPVFPCIWRIPTQPHYFQRVNGTSPRSLDLPRPLSIGNRRSGTRSFRK